MENSEFVDLKENLIDALNDIIAKIGIDQVRLFLDEFFSEGEEEVSIEDGDIEELFVNDTGDEEEEFVEYNNNTFESDNFDDDFDDYEDEDYEEDDEEDDDDEFKEEFVDSDLEDDSPSIDNSIDTMTENPEIDDDGFDEDFSI